MSILTKSLPLGSLPYDNITLTTQMMIRLFESIPFLPSLPKIDESDTIINRTIANNNIFSIDKNKVKLNICFDSAHDKNRELLDNAYFNSTVENLSHFKFNSVYLEQYFKVIKRIQPKETVINIMGPFSLAATTYNYDTEILLTDSIQSKFLVQYITVKALWIISKIREFAPNTKPIIIMEEDKLCDFGKLKKDSNLINENTLTSLYSKLVKKLHDNDAYVGVQCLSKCNWRPILNSEVDLISFDAYSNPSNLNIYADNINQYLAKGGCINWGIVPVRNETVIKSLKIDKLTQIFTTITKELIHNGVSADLLYPNSMVSVQGNTSEFMPLFAEKAMILATQLAKKIPTMK